MNGCNACGRVALDKNQPWWTREGVKLDCDDCGGTGVQSPFQKFPAGLRAPLPFADDSYWRNEVARKILRVAKAKSEKETSGAYAILTVIKARLIAFRERVFNSVAERAAP